MMANHERRPWIRRAERPERLEPTEDCESFRARYGVVVVCALAALFYVAVGWLADQPVIALAGVIIMGAYGALAFIGGRTGRLRMLRGAFDEREQAFDRRAMQASWFAMLLALLTLWTRDVLDGRLGTWPQWIIVLAGVTYLVALVLSQAWDR